VAFVEGLDEKDEMNIINALLQNQRMLNEDEMHAILDTFMTGDPDKHIYGEGNG